MRVEMTEKAKKKAYYLEHRERFKQEQAAQLNRVDNAPLREALERKETSLHTLATFMDVPNPKKSAQQIARSLGMQWTWDNGKKQMRKRISYDLAVRIARAAHIDPVDVGL